MCVTASRGKPCGLHPALNTHTASPNSVPALMARLASNSAATSAPPIMLHRFAQRFAFGLQGAVGFLPRANHHIVHRQDFFCTIAADMQAV